MGGCVLGTRLLLNLPPPRRSATAILDTFPNQYPTCLDVSSLKKLLSRVAIVGYLPPLSHSVLKVLDLGPLDRHLAHAPQWDGLGDGRLMGITTTNTPSHPIPIMVFGVYIDAAPRVRRHHAQQPAAPRLTISPSLILIWTTVHRSPVVLSALNVGG